MRQAGMGVPRRSRKWCEVTRRALRSERVTAFESIRRISPVIKGRTGTISSATTTGSSAGSPAASLDSRRVYPLAARPTAPGVTVEAFVFCPGSLGCAADWKRVEDGWRTPPSEQPLPVSTAPSAPWQPPGTSPWVCVRAATRHLRVYLPETTQTAAVSFGNPPDNKGAEPGGERGV